MNKLLLIVDPQVDFVNGTLPISQAEEAMDTLAQYIKDTDGEYTYKVVTTDWHPYHHCSFTVNGGQWPVHCVQHSVGAAIWPSLIAPLNITGGTLEVLHKGLNPTTEEYSIFKNSDSAARIREIVAENNIEQIDLCGLAGDYCVLDTLKDGVTLFGKKMWHVLTPYSPSIDGGAALNEYLNTLNS